MLIACVCLIGVLLIFVLVTFLMTHKNYNFAIQGGKLRVQTVGSHLKLYFNDNLIKDVFSPHLFNGEVVDFKIEEKELKVCCQCNAFGNKLKVEILDGKKVVASNGVEFKKSKSNKV